jgi:hypothetical protein
VRGGYTHNWNAYWNSSIFGAYAAVRYNGEAKTLLCGVGGVGGSLRVGLVGLQNCNPDYEFAQIGVNTRWTPVKNLTFTGEFVYQHLNQNNSGIIAFASGAVGKPAATYEVKNQDTYQFLMRAQRNF